MGREALCRCDWSGVQGEVKALLETTELIVRGEIRKRIPFRDLRDLRVEDGKLCFITGDDAVALYLGEAPAEAWAKAISTPPTLAKKLGISGKTVLRLIGRIEDGALHAAVAEAGKMASDDCNLILACVKSPEDLRSAVHDAKADLGAGVPIWLVYPKGSGKSLSESMIRSMLLAEGLVDTKVAGVSGTLTAMRWNRRKS